MSRVKRFIKTTLVGGLVALLPLAILLAAFSWIYGFVAGILRPLTDYLMTQLSLPSFLINLIVLACIVCLFFLLGLVVRTRWGRLGFYWTEDKTLRRIPGYGMLRQTIVQFSSRERSPFRSVALARPFGNDTLVMAFVTDRHSDGSYTVFVPTGPNPTSGNIYFLKAERVHEVATPVNEAVRMVISCGAGSAEMLRGVPQEAAA